MNYDLVLHLDSNDPGMMRLLFSNVENYLNALENEKFQLDIVVNGPGVVNFTREHGDYMDTASKLAQRGANFKLCANALAAHKLTPDHVWPFCAIVPAGLVEIVRLQRMGFAYIKP